MARPLKRGLEYFPLDTNFLYERKMQRLMHTHGNESVLVYLTLLTDIYSNEGYYIEVDKNMYFDIAFTLSMTEEKVELIVKSCLQVGLFDRELYKRYGILTSTGIQRRYFVIVRRTKRMYNLDYLTKEYCEEHSIERPDPLEDSGEEAAKTAADCAVKTKVSAAKTATKKKESKNKIKEKTKKNSKVKESVKENGKEKINGKENSNSKLKKTEKKENRIEENGIEENEPAFEKKGKGFLGNKSKNEIFRSALREVKRARTNWRMRRDAEENKRELVRQEQIRELQAQYPESFDDA